MEFLKEFLKDFLKEFRRETTASEIPEEALCVQSLPLLNAPRPGGSFGSSPLDMISVSSESLIFKLFYRADMRFKTWRKFQKEIYKFFEVFTH